MNKLVKAAIDAYKKHGYYITNCYLSRRECDEILFDCGDLSVNPKLNGYAIIPLDEYIELSGDVFFNDGFMDRIKEFDFELSKIKPVESKGDQEQ